MIPTTIQMGHLAPPFCIKYGGNANWERLSFLSLRRSFAVGRSLVCGGSFPLGSYSIFSRFRRAVSRDAQSCHGGWCWKRVWIGSFLLVRLLLFPAAPFVPFGPADAGLQVLVHCQFALNRVCWLNCRRFTWGHDPESCHGCWPSAQAPCED